MAKKAIRETKEKRISLEIKPLIVEMRGPEKNNSIWHYNVGPNSFSETQIYGLFATVPTTDFGFDDLPDTEFFRGVRENLIEIPEKEFSSGVYGATEWHFLRNIDYARQGKRYIPKNEVVSLKSGNEREDNKRGITCKELEYLAGRLKDELDLSKFHPNMYQRDITDMISPPLLRRMEKDCNRFYALRASWDYYFAIQSQFSSNNDFRRLIWDPRDKYPSEVLIEIKEAFIDKTS